MAVGITRNDRISSFVLEKAVPIISNEIKRNDGIVGILGAKNRIKMVTGGDLFEERVQYKENTNVAFRDKFAQIPTAQQSNWLTAKYGQATITGSIVINEIEEAQNASSEYRISSLLEALIQNARDTYVRQMADAFRAAAPAANEPNSVPSMVQATAFGAQTTSGAESGFLSRTTYNDWWQNQLNATAAALSAQAGLATLEAFYWQSVAKGSALSEQPDFGLTTGTVFASLSSYHDTLIRHDSNSALGKLGFSTLKVLNMEIIADPAITAGYLYMLNTNYLRLQVLKTRNMENVGDTPDTIPLSMKPMQDDIDTLNKVQLLYATLNLTTNSLQRQGLMSSVS